MEFVLNVDDYPFIVGGETFQHPLPLFSLYQTRDHVDILTPSGSFRQRSFDALLQPPKSRLPWSQRRNEVFWRGSNYCGWHPFKRCSRLLLSHLSALNVSSMLKVGLTHYTLGSDPYALSSQCSCQQRAACAGDLPTKVPPLATHTQVSMKDHAAYKYLLHLDGNSASNRLQQLLALNSVVIKQASLYWAGRL